MDLTDVPTYFSELTGINVTTAQLILSVVIICMLLFPYLILAHKEPSPLISIFLVFIGLAISLGLGWAPFWIMIMLMVITGSALALLGAKTVTGNGG